MADSTSLGVFMTLGNGLATWERTGSLDRELEVYRRYLRAGWQVTLFTYDRQRLGPVPPTEFTVVSKAPRFLPTRLLWLYALLMPFLFYRLGRDLSVLKTNQSWSGWPAIWCGWIWRRPVVARCGYVYGETMERLGLRGLTALRRRFLESRTFKNAALCLVPTRGLREWLVRRYGIDAAKIVVMPNSVDVDRFKPDPQRTRKEKRGILSIGRLVPVKQHHLLIAACAGKEWQPTLVGEGRLRAELTHYAAAQNVPLQLTGRVANQDLPGLLNRTGVFVLCSQYEGHPKALLEAMGCGCPCVGTNVAGIGEIIRHGETGLLADSSPAALREAIQRIFADSTLARKLGENARQFVLKHYSVKENARREMQLMLRVTAAKRV